MGIGRQSLSHARKKGIVKPITAKMIEVFLRLPHNPNIKVLLTAKDIAEMTNMRSYIVEQCLIDLFAHNLCKPTPIFNPSIEKEETWTITQNGRLLRKAMGKAAEAIIGE